MRDCTQYIHARRPLYHTAEAIRRGHITIGFIGGSITEPVADGHRWSGKIVDWFVAEFPGLIVDEENAAKGATGSLNAILRVEDDILAYNCDLVFVETAVNDGEKAWGACREGILRKLMKNDVCDVVLTYTYSQAMYETMLAGKLPQTILDWEELAEHYQLSSVHMARYTFDLVMDGFLRWDEWLPDTLHPDHAGSRLYAEPVCRLLRREIDTARPVSIPLPAPLHADNWENVHILPFDQVERVGAWRQVHERRLPSVHHMLCTSSMTSSLRFEFEGTGLLLHLLSGGLFAAYKIRIDGGEWIDKNDPLPAWGLNATDWLREDVPVSGLPAGRHTAEIAPEFAQGGRATRFQLGMIGVIC